MQARWLGWWYLAIGLGFTLLGARQLVVGAPAWQALLRFAIAAGFFLLAWSYLGAGRRTR
ncbi:MAG: hypothetical protein ACP5U2_14055 [Bryobacteraceae bacterium]